MPLASSGPHEEISVDVLGPRIVIWPMDLLGHGSVLTEAAVVGGVGVHLGPVIRVVGDVRRCLPLAGAGGRWRGAAVVATGASGWRRDGGERVSESERER
jgi:hypothetical protein